MDRDISDVVGMMRDSQSIPSRKIRDMLGVSGRIRCFRPGDCRPGDRGWCGVAGKGDGIAAQGSQGQCRPRAKGWDRRDRRARGSRPRGRRAAGSRSGDRAARAPGQEMGSQGQGFAGQGIVCKTKSLLRTSFSQNLCTIIMQLLQGTRLEVYLTRVQDNLYHTWSTHC